MLATTATVVVALVVLVAVSSILFRRREIHFELIPNQLLTRRPIVFLSGDRSIFYFTRYWNQIPSFLTEHGFEVYKAPLPWKKGSARSARIQAILQSWEKQNFACHLFVDPSIQNEVSQVIEQHPSASILSLNVVCGATETPPSESQPKLKSLPIAWREVRWPASTGSTSLYWHAHRFLTKTPTQPQHLGLPLDENLKSSLLEHLKVLAERDFTMPN